MLRFRTEHSFLEDVDKDDMRVGATGDDAVALCGNGFGEDFGVGDYLACVGRELGR